MIVQEFCQSNIISKRFTNYLKQITFVKRDIKSNRIAWYYIKLLIES